MSTRLADIDPSLRRIIAFGEKPEGTGLSFGFVDAVAVGVGFLNPLAWAYLIGKKAVESAKATPSAPSEVLFVALNSVDERIQFPPGHPVANGVYACSPVRHSAYFTYAEFHNKALREKSAELFRLLAGLRADRISIQIASGRIAKGSLDLGMTVPADVPIELGAEGRTVQGNVTNVRYSAQFTGQGPPRVPNDLMWFPHEPEWRSIAEARLEQGLTDFSIRMRYTDDFNVTGALKAAIDGIGFKIGGAFQEFESEEWTITGTFVKKPVLGW